MEAVVIISELPKPIDHSCFRACGLKTEVGIKLLKHVSSTSQKKRERERN